MKPFVVALLILIGCSSQAVAQPPGKDVVVPERDTVNPLTLPQQLAEINKNFTYHGVPIHPRAIRDLTSWFSDGVPGPVAIDVNTSLNSNRYHGSYGISETRDVFIDFKKQVFPNDGWFSYRYLGRLENGLHVLQTADNGGGKGIFENLLLVECTTDYEYEREGQRRELLVMKRRGEFGLGDRYSGEVKLDPKQNTIVVGACPRNMKELSRIKLLDAK
ncbi:MAG: hypothetical protein V4719_25040 [Planctomycetota bacterium]